MSVDDDMSDSDAEGESDCEDEDEDEDQYDDGSGEYTGVGSRGIPETAPRRPLKRGRKAPARSRTPRKRAKKPDGRNDDGPFPCGFDACSKVFVRYADALRHMQRSCGLRLSESGRAVLEALGLKVKISRCSHCKTKYSRKDAAQRHARTTHPDASVLEEEDDSVAGEDVVVVVDMEDEDKDYDDDAEDEDVSVGTE